MRVVTAELMITAVQTIEPEAVQTQSRNSSNNDVSVLQTRSISTECVEGNRFNTGTWRVHLGAPTIA